MLTPCLAAVDGTLEAWRTVRLNPVKARTFRAQFPGLASRLNDLLELWGEDGD